MAMIGLPVMCTTYVLITLEEQIRMFTHLLQVGSGNLGIINLHGSPIGTIGLEASYSRPAAQLYRAMYDNGDMGYMTSFVGTGQLGLSKEVSINEIMIECGT